MCDLLITNAELIPLAATIPGADAVAVEGERVVAIGRTQDLLAAAGPTTRRIDAGGRTLAPAFADPHIHLWKVGQLARSIADLRGSRDLAEVRRRLDLRAAQIAGEAWLLGRGVNEQLLVEGRLPDRGLLDQWFGDHPVLVTRACAHVAIANSAALRRAGVGAGTADPQGGVVERDAAGEPTGILNETAIELVQRHVPPPSETDYRDWIGAALRRKLAQGCGSATDPGVGLPLIAAYLAMEAAGELPLRCHAMRLAPEDGPVDTSELPAPYFSDRLTIDTAKFFLDGGLSGATAALSVPYRHADHRGVLRMDADEFAARLAPYAAAGYAIAAHAIGDVAIEAGLAAYGEAGGGAPRRRLEHFGLPTVETIATAEQLGVIVVTQPAFLPELGANFRAYLPDELPAKPYPFRSMIEGGLTVAFSSDAPVVVDDSPLGGIVAAVTREAPGGAVQPSQRITVEQALRAYTTGAAGAEGVAQERGAIAVGRLADLVLLSHNPLTTPVEDFGEIAVEATIVGGSVNYER